MASDYVQLKELAREYLKARHEFLTKSTAYPELAGNDNLMGRIGEMIAVQFLRSHGRKVNKYSTSNHAVTDLYTAESENASRSISVKLISAENKLGATTPLKNGWDEFILVELLPNYEVKRLGWLTVESLPPTIQKMLLQKAPITSRRMLEADGLIGSYGKVYDSRDPMHAPILKALL